MGNPDRQPLFDWGIWVLAGGYLLVAVALGQGYSGTDAEFTGAPTCDGRPMEPGDTCRVSVTRTRPLDLDVSDYSYEEQLAAAQRDVKLRPWSRGMLIGTAGTVAVFVGAGRHLAVSKRPSRRRAGRSVLAITTLPLLAVAALLWALEQRYDPEIRRALDTSSLWPFDPQLPGAPSLMLGLVLVGTAVVLPVVLRLHLQQAVFGLGSWGAARVFSRLGGVHRTEIGWAGGGAHAYLDERHRHARVVRVSFDPGRISYQRLLGVFWEHYDPDREFRQEARTGHRYRYRLAIYATSREQLAAASASREAFAPVAKAARLGPIGVEIAMLDRFKHPSTPEERRGNHDSDGAIAPNGLAFPLSQAAGGLDRSR
jgi:peptide-methionine (S)-S-oxide reductase